MATEGPFDFGSSATSTSVDAFSFESQTNSDPFSFASETNSDPFSFEPVETTSSSITQGPFDFNSGGTSTVDNVGSPTNQYGTSYAGDTASGTAMSVSAAAGLAVGLLILLGVIGVGIWFVSRRRQRVLAAKRKMNAAEMEREQHRAVTVPVFAGAHGKEVGVSAGSKDEKRERRGEVRQSMPPPSYDQVMRE